MAEINTSCAFKPRSKNAAEAKDYTDFEAEEHAKEVNAYPRPVTGTLVNGKPINEIDSRGEFIRQANSFITPFGFNDGEIKPEANRFVIYWANFCNWSNRPVIVRDILGLTNIIADESVLPTAKSNKYGWGFTNYEGHKDPITGAYFLSQFYRNADPTYNGRATTPSIVDLKTKKVVNNDYHRLTNYLEVKFRAFQPKDAPDLYPKAYRKEIDEFNDWLFPHVNNGHYRMAFAQEVEPFDEAYEDFYDSLEKLDKRLETNRFLFGDYITDSDIRFYVTLVRWETWYYQNVGPIKKRIFSYKNIGEYVKDLYAIPEFRRYTFFPTDESANDKSFRAFSERIAPKIDYRTLWASDGKRALLSSDPNHVYLYHDLNETSADYDSEISKTIWNSENDLDRYPKNGVISVDPSINPLKGKLKNRF